MLLDGAPGSGKTRLLQDHAQAKRWPAPVGARPGDEAVPYALLARWLDTLCDHFRAALTPELRAEVGRFVPRLADAREAPPGVLEPARLAQALGTALMAWQALAVRESAGAHPGLLLDDLQFADDASLALLLELAALTPASGWFWTFAYRSGAELPLLQQWYERRAPGQAVQVHLAALTEPQVEALLASLQLPGLDAHQWAPPLLAYCGGHPFFIVDALAGLHLEGRHDFSGGPHASALAWQRPAAVSRRVEQLPDSARQLAQVAAVAGQDFDVELAAAVLRCAPVALAAPWRVLEQAGLFRGAGFAHDLLGPGGTRLGAGGDRARAASPDRGLARRWLGGCVGRRAHCRALGGRTRLASCCRRP